MDRNIFSTKLINKLHWYHWFILSASLLLTLSAWYITTHLAEQKTKLQFDFQAELITKLVKERMKHYEEALNAGVAATNTRQRSMDTASWKIFSDSFAIDKKYPGIKGISLVSYVKNTELADFIQRQQTNRPEFSIKPKSIYNDHFPITYIEPIEGNQKAIGFDIGHEKNRRAAAINARDTGLTQITAPIVLVQDALKTPGFLFLAPFYSSITAPESLAEKQQKFKGVISAPFIMNMLMEGTLENNNRLVNFKISDGEHLLYNELNNDSAEYDAAPLYSVIQNIEMYGRTWQFNIQSSTIFRQQVTNKQPLMILIGGLTVDLILLVLFVVLTQFNKNATDYADKVTRHLRASEDKLIMTINNMSDALITVNNANKILSFNRTAEHIFGLTQQEAISSSIAIFPNNNDADSIDSHYLNIRNIGHRKHVNITNARGNQLIVDITIKPIESADDTFFIIIIRDMTVSSRVEQAELALINSEKLMAASINSTPAGYAVIDEHFNIIECNNSLCNWLNVSESQLKHASFLNIINKTKEGLVTDSLNSLLDHSEKIVHIESLFNNKLNGSRWGNLSAALVTPHYQQTNDHIVIHIIDIENEKQLLHRLERKNRALEKSNADLSQFAYIASHDLKSPLNAISQLASWIRDDCLELLPAESVKHLDLMMGRCKRMSRLLSDLLNYSKVGKYNYAPQDIDFKSLVNEQVNLIDAENFIFHVDEAQLIVPVIPFELILRNLISNAIKHHDKKPGVITLKAEVFADEQVITVTDDGPGIPPDMHDKAFKMFNTLKSRDEVEGSGMGLSMVKQIVSHYHGQVKIKPSFERGTSVVFRWPINHQTEHTSTNENTLIAHGVTDE